MYDTIQKTIIAWVFNHYIAYYYFDNVNVNQLKVAFENGEIELENLPIKRDALRHLKLPWDVASGMVGKLSIRIPLMKLLTDPWVIKISNLMLIATPGEIRKLDLAIEDSDETIKSDQSSNIDPLQYRNDATPNNRTDISGDNPNEKEVFRKSSNSEETKLAEFYSSFSATVSAAVKDIYRNIKLEIGSTTLLFEKFDHGLVKLSADNLLLHRPDLERKVVMDNVSLYFSSMGPYEWNEHDDLLRINLNACSVELHDVSNENNHTSLEINSETDIYGNLFMVNPVRSSIPICEFLLEDFRMLYFSGNHQQDWSIFARASCSHFNREASSWSTFLKPWPFNLSWDRRTNHKKISLTSDDPAEITMSSALLDLFDVIHKRVTTEPSILQLWPVSKSTVNHERYKDRDIDPIFVLHNQTGHRLFYALTHETHDFVENSERFKPAKVTNWSRVEVDEMVTFDLKQSLLVRVEGWKMLSPIPLDRTGSFFRQACSDRVMNEDTLIVVSIDLESGSARKLISVRLPQNTAVNPDNAINVRLDSDRRKTRLMPISEQEDTPQDYKLFYYNYSTNLAQQIGNRAVRQLFSNHSRKNTSSVNITGPGFTIVLVDNSGDKIVELYLEDVAITSTTRSKEQIIDCSIQDIRISNALPDCEKTMVLGRAISLDQSLNSCPALRLIVDRIIGKSFGTVWFRQVQLSICELLLNVEEKVFLKLVEFISFRKVRRHKTNEITRDLDRLIHQDERRISKYYFDLLRIDLTGLKLNCFTSPDLPSSLQRLKSKLGLKFFDLEDAQLELSPFFKMNVSKTLRGIFDSVTKFYRRQISEQAPRIVGQQIQNYIWIHLSDLLSSLYDEVYNKLFY